LAPRPIFKDLLTTLPLFCVVGVVEKLGGEILEAIPAALVLFNLSLSEEDPEKERCEGLFLKSQLMGVAHGPFRLLKIPAFANNIAHLEEGPALEILGVGVHLT